MRIQVSESTAIKKEVTCSKGHCFEAWYIGTPEGIVVEFGEEHRLLPKDRRDPAYATGTCCFQAACELAWKGGLPL